MKTKLLRRSKYYALRILGSKKGDHQVALGATIGFFPCWFPTFGIGMALSAALARLCRSNMPAAIVSGSLGTILWPALFYMNYKVGHFFHVLLWNTPFDLDRLLDKQIPDSDYHETAWHLKKLGDLGIDFLLGSTFNSLVFFGVLYAIMRWLLKRYKQPLLRRLRQGVTQR
ncbi:hypothetical protein PA598K_05236 [Paenibacillus sp. 598K]|uniref:DUF2062 domain-containing protein n=1 Tax=Paenibacillus sp. 598K TaxID=1117987 RepID=UPI000FF98C28|nr:DUF2062 domain-containing protein [Paenibacillus sp. 598K]GBF76749.1 hypothetical protein PA598K_05236 [Paenibacillus sp. 598K]